MYGFKRGLCRIRSPANTILSPYCHRPFLKAALPYTGDMKPEDADLELPAETCTLHLTGEYLPDVPAATEDDFDHSPPDINGSTSPGDKAPPLLFYRERS